MAATLTSLETPAMVPPAPMAGSSASRSTATPTPPARTLLASPPRASAAMAAMAATPMWPAAAQAMAAPAASAATRRRASRVSGTIITTGTIRVRRRRLQSGRRGRPGRRRRRHRVQPGRRQCGRAGRRGGGHDGCGNADRNIRQCGLWHSGAQPRRRRRQRRRRLRPVLLRRQQWESTGGNGGNVSVNANGTIETFGNPPRKAYWRSRSAAAAAPAGSVAGLVDPRRQRSARAAMAAWSPSAIPARSQACGG